MKDGTYDARAIDRRNVVSSFIFWVLIIIGIFLLIVWLVRQSGGAGGRRDEETALDILQKRYARGEISSEEFEKMKKDIS